MMKSHQSRSKVVRTLIREALRARGYKLVESFDEKRDRERDS
jgi:metal-responsive CopG/Arc/MetJ family transcriptional regulator